MNELYESYISEIVSGQPVHEILIHLELEEFLAKLFRNLILFSSQSHFEWHQAC